MGHSEENATSVYEVCLISFKKPSSVEAFGLGLQLEDNSKDYFKVGLKEKTVIFETGARVQPQHLQLYSSIRSGRCYG